LIAFTKKRFPRKKIVWGTAFDFVRAEKVAHFALHLDKEAVRKLRIEMSLGQERKPREDPCARRSRVGETFGLGRLPETQCFSKLRNNNLVNEVPVDKARKQGTPCVY
jgi:hypothetical protein